MIDRPTPETERIKGALHTNWNDLMNHARKLERERDMAEDERIDLAKQLLSEQERHAVCQNERDEALEQIEVCRGIIERTVIARNSALSDLTELENERDEAREVLQEIEAARWHTACELRRIATQALGSKNDLVT